MNEAARHVLARHRVRLAKTLGQAKVGGFGLACALVLAAVAGACVGPFSRSSASAGPPRCADLVAHAFASPNIPVPGAFACLAPAVQKIAIQYGISDDASWAVNAAIAPVYSAYHYVGSKFDTKNMHLYYYFEYTPGPSCFRVRVDNSGLVAGFGLKQGACLPLP